MARKHHLPYAPTSAERALLGSAAGEVAVLRTPFGPVYAAVAPRASRTAVFELVQGVYEAFPGQAHALLRARILTTAPPRPLDRAVVQVAAKRLTAGVSPCEPQDVVRFDVSPFARRARATARRRARVRCDDPAEVVDIAQALPRGTGPLAAQDRPVVAALAGPDGRVLGATRNTAGRNRTLHAEVNLVQGWWAQHRTPLPDGSTVYVSLQPCRMCAALLAHAAGGRLTVCYGAPDPGRFARGTALQRGGPVFERHMLRK